MSTESNNRSDLDNETEQTQYQQENENDSDKGTTVLAKGLEEFFKPIVEQCDERIQEVFKSQAYLANQINSLDEEISKIPALGPYIQKLINARSKVNNINLVLDRISQRLMRIQASLNEDSQK